MASNETTVDWKEKIKEKLIALYEKKDQDDLVKIIWYLDEEDEKYRDSTETSPVWRTLRTAQKTSDFFAKYAAHLADNVVRAENDVPMSASMDSVFNEVLDQSKDPVHKEIKKSIERMSIAEANLASGLMAMAALADMPEDSHTKIMNLIPELMADNGALMAHMNGVDGSGSVGMAAVYLNYEAIEGIVRWWRAESSGRRCAKSIIDSMFTIEPLGSFIGPVGVIDGTSIGGIASAQIVNELIDRATQTLFGLPKEEALENAYNYLGVKMNASNSEINTKFLELCLQNHPDKGGKKEVFFLLQLNMGVIQKHWDQRRDIPVL